MTTYTTFRALACAAAAIAAGALLTGALPIAVLAALNGYALTVIGDALEQQRQHQS